MIWTPRLVIVFGCLILTAEDILIIDNKLYSKDTCVFISQEVNSFLTDCAKNRGLLPIGVCYGQGKYRAQCSGNGTQVSLGVFNTPEEAHKVWYYYKALVAKQLASEQTDYRVAEAILSRFPELN